MFEPQYTKVLLSMARIILVFRSLCNLWTWSGSLLSLLGILKTRDHCMVLWLLVEKTPCFWEIASVVQKKGPKLPVSRNRRMSNSKSVLQMCQWRVDYNILVSLCLPFSILAWCWWMQGTEVEGRFDKYHTSAEYSPPVYEVWCLHHLQRAFCYE